MTQPSWVGALAEWLLAAARTPPPREVTCAAARQTLDSVACAIGALDHDVAEVIRRAVDSTGASGPCTMIMRDRTVPVTEAILYNGTLVRALDCNDVFFRYGPLGHPSDTIAVPLAFAEQLRAPGAAFTASVAVGYELYWRLHESVLAAAGPDAPWDYSAVSALVAAAMAGLMLGLDEQALTHALAIAAVQGWPVRQVRTGQISMLKASAGALSAQAGAQAALLAAAGMTGPGAAFEGKGGLLQALRVEGTAALRDELTSEISDWHILGVSTKPYPAVGTSQGVITATLRLAQGRDIKPAEIERVEVRIADTPTTRRHLSDQSRVDPRTRESADHSIVFLVAVALEDRAVGLDQYRGSRWLRPATRDLMDRVTQTLDAGLTDLSGSSYPASVTVTTRDGQSYSSEVLKVPGSRDNPLSDEERTAKLRALASGRLSTARCDELADRLLRLDSEPDIADAIALLREDG